MNPRRCFLWAATVLTMATVPALAQWQDGGFVPDPQPIDQYYSAAAPDGSGGFVVAWVDSRDGTAHIYAQRINAWGEALWGPGGVPICTDSARTQDEPAIAGDGAGGAYIVWPDVVTSSGMENIYAQYVNGDGIVQWTVDGIAMQSTPTDWARSTDMDADGQGGAYLAWRMKSGSTESIRLMRLSPGGLAWSADGSVVRTGTDLSGEPLVVTIGREGAAVVVWGEYLPATGSDIWAGAVRTDGTPLWFGAVDVCDETGSQYNYDVVADGQDGIFCAWEDTRAAGGQADIYINRFDGYGSVWAFGGTLVCDATGYQESPQLVVTPGGVFVTWTDPRTGQEDLYCQRVGLQLDMEWADNGRLVCDAPQRQWMEDAIPDGAGGQILLWGDERTDNYFDLYADRLDANGYSLWGYNGVPITQRHGAESVPDMVSDGLGGILVTWTDDQLDPAGAYGVAVQRLERNGYWGYPAGMIAGVKDVPGDQGGEVLVNWFASRLDPWPDMDVQQYTLWRALPGAKAAVLPNDDWLQRIAAGELDEPIYRAGTGPDKSLFWELVETVDAQHLESYGRTVATYHDSTGTGPADHLFQIITHGYSPEEFWIAPPEVGRSVDNLAPATPLNLVGTGNYSPLGMTLAWDPNSETDLHHYDVHRGTAPGFVPNATNLVAAPTDTTAFDGGWDGDYGWHYKVAAVDLHGNVSGYALLDPAAVSGVGDGDLPRVTALVGARPNPFNPTTAVAYELARPEHVRLRIYDAAGRLVRTLVDAQRPRGRHEAGWDGRDSAGRPLGSGVYLCRMEAGEVTQGSRLTLIR